VLPVKSIPVIDERADPEQRLAFKGFARRVSKDLLQDIVRVYYQPVSLTFGGGDPGGRDTGEDPDPRHRRTRWRTNTATRAWARYSFASFQYRD
jgi:hypothetical protein